MVDLPLLRRCELILLRPDAARAEIEARCAEARRVQCQGVCVCGSRLELASVALAESDVRVTGLIAFPFGTSDPDVKRFEIEAAIDAGAQELQVVLNAGWLRDGNDAALLRELRDLRTAAEERPLAAIIEFGLLSADEIRRAANLTIEAELQFLATATGCAARATTVEDIQLVREAVGPDLGLIAVGGIQGPADAQRLVAAGANRFGVFHLRPFTEAPAP